MLRATHHPWPCLLFLLPLLAVYEYGVFALGGSQADAMRNGADAWIRFGLLKFGVREFLAVPILLVFVFIAWTSLRWADRPKPVVGVLFAMVCESLLYGFGLWTISRTFLTLLEAVGIPVSVPLQLSDEALARLITFIGAGIYEEVIFRLILLSGLAWLLKVIALPKPLAWPMAAVVSSLLFAAAHHIGPHGEPLVNKVDFLFRVTAGMYFSIIYWLRGFGVAVGAHAFYDVMVGIPWEAGNG